MASLVVGASYRGVNCSEQVRRLASFINPSSCKTWVPSAILAESGFFSNESGMPYCAKCQLVYTDISHRCLSRKDAHEYHLSNSPNCEVAKACHREMQCGTETRHRIYEPQQSRGTPVVISENNGSLNEKKIQLFRSSTEERLKTFHNWPKNNPMEPTDLARNGFIYTGERDNTKCVFCNGTLCQWEEGDIVAKEHAKHFPRCTFRESEEGFGLDRAESSDSCKEKMERVRPSHPDGDGFKCEEFKNRAMNQKAVRAKNPLTKEDIIRKTKELHEENILLKERKLCKLCLDRNADTVLLPCAHLVSCKECAPKMRDCAVCRTYIKGTVLCFIPEFNCVQ